MSPTAAALIGRENTHALSVGGGIGMPGGSTGSDAWSSRTPGCCRNERGNHGLEELTLRVSAQRRKGERRDLVVRIVQEIVLEALAAPQGDAEAGALGPDLRPELPDVCSARCNREPALRRPPQDEDR